MYLSVIAFGYLHKVRMAEIMQTVLIKEGVLMSGLVLYTFLCSSIGPCNSVLVYIKMSFLFSKCIIIVWLIELERFCLPGISCGHGMLC